MVKGEMLFDKKERQTMIIRDKEGKVVTKKEVLSVKSRPQKEMKILKPIGTKKAEVKVKKEVKEEEKEEIVLADDDFDDSALIGMPAIGEPNTSGIPMRGEQTVMFVPNQDDNNSFKEISKLLTEDGIRSKTILNDKQIRYLTRIESMYEIYMENGMNYQAKQLKIIARNFMTMVVNKDGSSRKQFIEAMQRGADRAEALQAEKAMRTLGGGMRI